MRLSDLQGKDIVNVVDGKKIGSIIDALVDRDGKLSGLVIEKRRILSMLSNNNDIEVKWEQIEKIGEDVILVNLCSIEKVNATLKG